MQADEVGLRETVLERKNKERQDVMHLGVLYCTQIWRPQGDLNPCRRRERPLPSYPSLPVTPFFARSAKKGRSYDPERCF